MKIQLLKLAIRWLVNSLGLGAASILVGGISFEPGLMPILGAGLVLALVNAIIKPIVIILSLPAILLSLGLFIVFINGFMVLIADHLYGGIEVDGLLEAILAGLVIGLVNYAVTVAIEGRAKE